MSSSAGLLKRGAVLYRKGEFVGALRVFEHYVDAHPRSAAGWLAMARALLRLREMDGALAACDCALALVPDHRAALEARERLVAEGVSAPVPSGVAGTISPEVMSFLAALVEAVLLG